MQPLIFFGSDQYSATVLNELLNSQYQGKISVVTDQRKPIKNNNLAEPTEIEKLAKTHNLNIYYYPSIPTKLSKNTVGLVASFNHLIPVGIINRFGGNLYNLHPSLLPQYRNVAPVPYALAMGDAVTGITMFRISEGIDNGEIVGQVQEPILATDTSPILLHRLFTKGVQLVLNFLRHSGQPTLPLSEFSGSLIFTRRLTTQHGFVQWNVLQKILAHSSVHPRETTNPLLELRFTHNPVGNILHDLVRALTGWEKVWTLAPTKKGELRLTIESVLPILMVKLAGKPKSISYRDFKQYYL